MLIIEIALGIVLGWVIINHYAASKRLLLYFLFWIIYIATLGSLIYAIFEFIPQPYSKYTFFAIFSPLLIFGYYSIIKDTYVSYKNGDTKYWIFGATVSLILLVILVWNIVALIVN